jgi:hypothetical protein
VLYLDLPIEDAMKRGDFGNEIYETEYVQKTVKNIYETQLWDDEYWHRVPANTTSDELQQYLSQLALKVISSLEGGQSPTQLWMSPLCSSPL